MHWERLGYATKWVHHTADGKRAQVSISRCGHEVYATVEDDSYVYHDSVHTGERGLIEAMAACVKAITEGNHE